MATSNCGTVTPAQRKRAVLASHKTLNKNLKEAFKDNIILNYASFRGGPITGPQGHGRVKMDDVRKHLEQTHFDWIGGTGVGSVFTTAFKVRLS